MMKDFCDKHNVPYKLCGKLIVEDSSSAESKERSGKQLSKLFDQGVKNGVHGLELIKSDSARILALEPELERSIASAIWSPETGIVCAHHYMQALEGLILNAGCEMVYNCVVQGVRSDPALSAAPSSACSHRDSAFVLMTSHGDIEVDYVVNAAGLHAPDLARSLMPWAIQSDTTNTDQGADDLIPCSKYARGSYWKPDFTHLLSAKPQFRRLVYPLPEPGLAGLGTHLTLDLDGSIRFGPNVEWIDADAVPAVEDDARSQSLYAVQEADERVHASVRKYFPHDCRLVPDYSGVRPKVEGCTDFVFLEAAEVLARMSRDDGEEGGSARGARVNQTHLLGMESPGLTSSLAIAEEVTARVVRSLSN